MELKRRTLLTGAGAGIALSGLPLATSHADAGNGRTFYVAAAGSDSATGRSPDTAWASTDRVNAETLRPGDRVLFRRGDTWAGNVVISDSGNPDAPIVVGAYGDGRRPRIDASLPADDLLAATVLVHNAEHVHVRDLELTNTANDEGMRNGVLVTVDAPTQPVYSNYVIQNLFIHDIAGRIEPSANDGKRSGGIGVLMGGTRDAVSRFDGITITDNTVKHVDQTGIWLDSDLRWGPSLPPGTDVVYRGYTWDQIKFTGVDIGYNKIRDTARNGVIIRMADGGSFHHNEVAETTGRVESGNSVFTVCVYRFTVEWNEVHHNLSHHNADGCAFDPDLDSPETVWRYNYSHDNSFGLMTLCTRPRDYAVEVYQNIDIGGRGRLMNFNYGFTDVTVSHNAFWTKPVPKVEYPRRWPEYVNPDRETAGGYPQVIWETHERDWDKFRDEQRYTYRNNTIYNQAPTATFYINPNDDTSLRTTERTIVDNTFYGRWPTDSELVDDGFTHAGPTPPKNWIADTVGEDVFAFWASSIAGRGNPNVGPRAA